MRLNTIQLRWRAGGPKWWELRQEKSISKKGFMITSRIFISLFVIVVLFLLSCNNNPNSPAPSSPTGVQDLEVNIWQQPHTVYAATISNGIFKTDDYQTWVQINSGLSTSRVECVIPTRYGILYAGTFNGIFKSSDGIHWSLLNSSITPNKLFVSSEGVIYAGMGTQIYQSSNGSSFTCTFANANSLNIECFAEAPSGHIYAGSFGGGMFVSFDGTTWSTINSPSQDVRNLFIDSNGHIYTTGGGGIYEANDVNNVAQISWTMFFGGGGLITQTSDGTFYGITGSTLFVSGYNVLAQSVYKKVANGNWSFCSTPTAWADIDNPNLLITSGNMLFAGCLNGDGVYGSYDGITWTPIN